MTKLMSTEEMAQKLAAARRTPPTRTAEEAEGDAQARWEEGKMSPAEKAKWEKEHPELAQNAKNPPPEVKELKDKMKSKKANGEDDEIEIEIEVAGYEIEIEIKKKDEEDDEEEDEGGEEKEAEMDIEAPPMPVQVVPPAMAAPPMSFKSASDYHDKAVKALVTSMQAVLGAMAQGHNAERVKALEKILRDWQVKWGVGIPKRLQEVAEDLLYKAFDIDTKVDPKGVEQVILRDYRDITWLGPRGARLASEGEFARQRLTWASDATSDSEKAEAAEARAEADEEKADAERDEARADRSDAASKEAAGGLYGFTKGTQRDVEASVRKIQRKALAIAKAAYGADERVVGFLQAHAKRANSQSARLLLGAMKAIGPKVAAGKVAADKDAGIGLYGFPSKTAMMGLNACTELRAWSGKVAYDLHSRRTARHERITGFLKEHSKQARCGYSRMLLGCYPDAPAEGKTASEGPQSVAEWLAWE